MTKGQLVMMAFGQSRKSREESQSTLHQCANGSWLYVVGGLQRGTVCWAATRLRAEQGIKDHYNRALKSRLDTLNRNCTPEGISSGA